MKEYWTEWSAQIVPWLLTHGLRIVVILVGAYFLNSLARRLIQRIVRMTVTIERHYTETAEKQREDTLIEIFNWSAYVVIFLVAIMLLLNEIGLPIGPIIAGAGIIGLAVGFGGQYLIRDFITGFFLILENQYRIGDVVSLDQTSGKVENISLRMTTLRDLDGTVHHIPHGDVKRVANLSMGFARINLDVSVAYNTDMEKVISCINEVGNELASDPVWKEFIIAPPQFLRLDSFSDSSIVLKILGETLPLKQWEITGELRKRLKIAFDKAGITMPFPQRVIHQYKHSDPD